MRNEIEGIVLRKTKTTKGRTMVTLFTKELGKIGAGTSIGQRAKGKGANAINVFTYGSYGIGESSWGYSIYSGRTIKSFFDISSDMGKYGYASYAVELTDKAFMENVARTDHFYLLRDFFSMIEKRKQGVGTLFIGFMLKTLMELGVGPQMKTCSECGKKVGDDKNDKCFFSVPAGGIVCGNCQQDLGSNDSSLIFPIGIDIINIVLYCVENPIRSLEKVAIREDYESAIRRMVIAYSEHHLALGKLKSKDFLPH